MGWRRKTTLLQRHYISETIVEYLRYFPQIASKLSESEHDAITEAKSIEQDISALGELANMLKGHYPYIWNRSKR